MNTVIFAVENADRAIYDVLMPLYFPRSDAEEDAARWQLPADVGGSHGEPIMPDREIRIIDNPQHTFHRKYATRLTYGFRAGIERWKRSDGAISAKIRVQS